MTALIIFVMGTLLVGAVVLGIFVNHKRKGKPNSGRNPDGTPRPSS